MTAIRGLAMALTAATVLGACAEDPVAPPRAQRTVAAAVGASRVSLPGTASATLEWLGEPPGYTGLPEDVNASGTVVGRNSAGSSVGILWDPPKIVSTLGVSHVYAFFAVNDAGNAAEPPSTY